MAIVQVGTELKKGVAEDPEQLLRRGSALDVAQNHLLACSSAREGFEQDRISPRPCPEDQPGPASQAGAAGRLLHDSPDSLDHAEQLTRAISLEQLPVMLRRQLADGVVAAGQPHAASGCAQQPEQPAQLGTFCWDLAGQLTGGNTPFHEAASTADSGESSASWRPCLRSRMQKPWAHSPCACAMSPEFLGVEHAVLPHEEGPICPW